jgi:translation initiation factor eIF-2B subunit delta
MLKEIIEDRKSGSSRIVRKTLELLEIVDESERSDVIREIRKAHPSMAGISQIMKLAMEMDITEIKEKFLEMDEKTIENLNDLVSGKTVVAISRSHITEKGLLSAGRVIVLTSEPGGEGRDTYRYLTGNEVDSTIVSDSMMGYAVSECDIVVVGADTILASGFVNKVGTLPLALTARHCNKEFYVAAPSYKIADECDVRMPFEFVPKEFVTAVVCEKGICRFWDLFKNHG